MSMRTITVPTNRGAYPIIIAQGLLGQTAWPWPDNLAGYTKAVVVADERLLDLPHWPQLQAQLAARGLQILGVVAVASGEASKCFEQLQSVLAQFGALGLQRNHLVVAFGGGVIGDLAGFAASIWQRGVGLLQVPTTLLSQIDSSVGGKTGINVPVGKNMVGSFYPPHAVLIDPNLLQTLAPRERLAGYAEMVKCALINQPQLWALLQTHGPALWQNLAPADVLVQAIALCCQAKADIVAKDEFETGFERMLLNLGHSFGHALEALHGYDGKLLHGEAVLVGLWLATAFSACHGHLAADKAAGIQAFLALHGANELLKQTLAPWPVASIVAKMQADKKNQGSNLRLILLRDIAHGVEAFVQPDVAAADVETFLTNIALLW